MFNSLPQWVQDTLKHSNRIRNVNTIQFQTSEQLYTVPLEMYEIVLYGRVGSEEVHLVRILGNLTGVPLVGPHLMEWFQPDCTSKRIWVKSLTTFKQKLCHMNDHLSFERAAYVIMHTSETLIRLKCIRSITTLPMIKQIHLTDTVFENDAGSVRRGIARTISKSQKLLAEDMTKDSKRGQRLSNQLQSYVGIMATAYTRGCRDDATMSNRLQQMVSDLNGAVSDCTNSLLKIQTTQEPVEEKQTEEPDFVNRLFPPSSPMQVIFTESDCCESLCQW